MVFFPCQILKLKSAQLRGNPVLHNCSTRNSMTTAIYEQMHTAVAVCHPIHAQSNDTQSFAVDTWSGKWHPEFGPNPATSSATNFGNVLEFASREYLKNSSRLSS
jgi:hypothetical protein